MFFPHTVSAVDAIGQSFVFSLRTILYLIPIICKLPKHTLSCTLSSVALKTKEKTTEPGFVKPPRIGNCTQIYDEIYFLLLTNSSIPQFLFLNPNMDCLQLDHM